MRKIEEIIVHCTANREGQDVTLEQIRDYHVRHCGYNDIGYHWLVTLDGEIKKGRPMSKVGAHCIGHNAYSIGIAYVGGLDSEGNPKDTRTPAQKEALRMLISDLRRRYPIRRVLGHRDASPDRNGNGVIEPSEYVKACPCFDALKEYDQLL